jgi:hypothetical protein
MRASHVAVVALWLALAPALAVALGPTCAQGACAGTTTSRTGSGDCAASTPASRDQQASLAFAQAGARGSAGFESSCASPRAGGASTTAVSVVTNAGGPSRVQLVWTGTTAAHCRSDQYTLIAGVPLHDGDLGCPVGPPPAAPLILP